MPDMVKLQASQYLQNYKTIWLSGHDGNLYRVNSPGKQGSSQMLPSEKTKTNKIAKT